MERRGRSDRRRGWAYRFVDERSGFDRRRRYPVLGAMRDNPRVLLVVLVLVNVLSWFDGLLTLIEVSSGVAREGNPVLAGLYARNPALAIALKAALILVVSISIWRHRHYRVMLAVAVGALVAFTVLLAYHLGSLYGLGML